MNKFLAIRLNYSFHVSLCCPKYTHEILIEEKQSWETQTSKLLYKMEKTVCNGNIYAKQSVFEASLKERNYTKV